MLISDFDYFLPEELIAQQPADRRDESKMLVADRQNGKIFDHKFIDLPQFLKKNDLLVINNTKVFPARLFGSSETGARIEVFLVREAGHNKWEALARPARRLRPGKRIIFDDRLSGSILDKLPDGKVIIQFETDLDLDEIVDELGKMPLPPYIKRTKDSPDPDRERYQTVYARKRGAIAAPTAGLHFTPETLEKIRERGGKVAEITLHVGYGTFEPIRVDDVAEHTVLPEDYEIDELTAETLNRAKKDGNRVIAVGTTTTRAIESNIAEFARFVPGKHTANLTITPGYKFRAVDALLTNFHLPKSSLLVLTSVFGGHELIMNAYRHAVAASYRFYSYGDCMLIV